MPSPAARLAVRAATILVFLAAPAAAANFTCAAPATCTSAIGYTVPNATTYGELVARFNTTTLGDLLGANGFSADTPAAAPVAANTTLRIPFRCRCAGNGVGQSDHAPVYTVQPQDGLDAIARNVFGAFVTYQEIATANSIPDPNKILVNQTLWIPLPCSCDKVDGDDVMHLAYSVAGGDTTAGITAAYGVSESTLLRLNNIADPKSLKKEQILDVPIPACQSSISDTSPDHNLLLLPKQPNGTYAFTARDCIKCSCSSASKQLDCAPVKGKAGCPEVPACEGSLQLGQGSGTGCGSKVCAYTGYSTTSFSISTALVANQTACQNGGAARPEFAGSLWRMSAIAFHMVLILIFFL